VQVYQRHGNNSLELVSAIDTKVGIDNLKFDERTGNIYAGSLAKISSNVDTVSDYPNQSPDNFYAATEIQVEKDSDGKLKYTPRNLVVTSKLTGISNGLKM